MHRTPILFLLLTGSLYQITNACGKRPNFRPILLPTTTQKPTADKNAAVNVSTTVTVKTPRMRVTPNPFGIQHCTKDEESTPRCVNGGMCYWILLGTMKLFSCICPKQYTGKRCQFLTIITGETGDGSRTVPVAVGVSCAVIVIIIIIILAIWSYKRVRRKRREKKQDYTNGNKNEAEEMKPMHGSNVNMDEMNGNNADEIRRMNVYEEVNAAEEYV